MCRKLETEQEKVLPFYASSLTQEEEEQTKAAELEEPTEILAKVYTNRNFVPTFLSQKRANCSKSAAGLLPGCHQVDIGMRSHPPDK